MRSLFSALIFSTVLVCSCLLQIVAGWHEPRSKPRCSSTRPYIHCQIPACHAEKLLGTFCQRDPSARCRDENCGGCVARHIAKGKEIHCGPEENVVCELQNTSISCQPGYVIKVHGANYGRTNTHTCRHSFNLEEMHNNTRCYNNVTDRVRENCNGSTRCWPQANSFIYGDSCYGIYKYLEVDFSCELLHPPQEMVMTDINAEAMYSSSASVLPICMLLLSCYIAIILL